MRDYQPEPVTQILDLADFDEALTSVVAQVSRREARVLVEEHGEPVAVIISIDDMRRFSRLEDSNKERFAVFDRIEAAFADVPIDEIETEADRAIAAVRANARAGAANE
jgi:prevent-host-death family protein